MQLDDLDQHEVLDLKGRILEAAGASKKHGQTAKYPLHAGSYTSAVVDLNSPSWTETLINAGETAEGMHEDCTCCQWTNDATKALRLSSLSKGKVVLNMSS